MSLRAKWAALFFLTLYFAFRISKLASGYNHIDDIGPLTLLLRWHEFGLNGLWHQLRIWTYAPGPYALTFPLLGLVRSPQAVLSVARGVSLAGWALGLAMSWSLFESLRRCFAPHWPRLLNVGLLFWALASWRGAVESSQSYNYAWTLAVAALLLGYLVTRLALPAIELRPWRGVRDGLILGISMGFSYQAMFIAAGVFGALAFLRWRGVDRPAWREEAATAVGFGAWVWMAQHFHLRHLQMLPGHPYWALGYPSKDASTIEGLFQMAQGAWGAVQNVLAVAPWGVWTAGLSAAALFAAALGLLTKPPTVAQARLKAGLLVFGGLLFLLWCAGSWTLRFPFGPTRHTFILQLPLLVLLGLGLHRLPKWLLKGGFVGLAAVWVFFYPSLFAGTRGQVDLKRVEELLDQHPGSMAIEAKLAFTRDHMLLWKARPDLQSRLYCDEMGDLVLGPHAPTGLVLLSHRGPLTPEAQSLLVQGGYRAEQLEARAATGSWELAGDLNGGNGFYLYYAAKAPKKP